MQQCVDISENEIREEIFEWRGKRERVGPFIINIINTMKQMVVLYNKIVPFYTAAP